MSELLQDLKYLLTEMQSANDSKDSFPKEGPVTTDQVAKYFNVTPKTIGLWLKKNTDFPRPVAINKNTVRYDAENIRAYWLSKAKNKLSGD